MIGFEMPLGLNLEEVIRLHPPKFKVKINVLKYIVSVIVDHQKFADVDDFPDFVPISATILRGITYDYKQHVEYLISQGIIEPLRGPEGTESYQVGSSCKRYKLVGNYTDVHFEPITDGAFLKKAAPMMPAPNYLVKWFNPNLSIDEEAAVAIMDSSEGKKPLSDLLAIRKIQQGYFELSRDRWGYRTYSNLTSLRAPYRKCLLYEGKKLVGLDLKSSQPWLIAATLLNPKFYETTEEALEALWNGKFDGPAPKIPPIPPNTNTYTPMPTPLGLQLDVSSLALGNSMSTVVGMGILQHNRGVTLENIIGQYRRLFRHCSHCSRYSLYYVSDFLQHVKEYLSKPDVAQFRYIVQHSDIYEALRERVPAFKYRDAAKEAFWSIFYGKVDSKPKGKKALMREFPSVFAILNLFKTYSKHLPWYREEKPHAALAVLLQFIESAIFIDSICKRLAVQHPDVPVFTIHDSLLTVQGEEDKVEAVMVQSLTKLVGAVPTIKRTYYGVCP